MKDNKSFDNLTIGSNFNYFYLRLQHFINEYLTPGVATEMLYCGKSGPKTPNSYQDLNLGAPEYKAVTIANMLQSPFKGVLIVVKYEVNSQC